MATQAGTASTITGQGNPKAVADSLLSGVPLYASMGAHLYSALCAGAGEDPDVVEMASHCLDSSRSSHLITCVHYMLLRDPSDPLARYFATITPNPEPPEQAYPDFARYCREHRDEIMDLIGKNTVQMTYADRAGALMPAMSVVAREAGEPLNLIEIGCSAGALLTFDKYAYDLGERGRIGPADAPLTITPTIKGGPELHIPKIGSRTGIDLHTIDVTSEDQRRWILASCFPEFREQQKRLATALDVVAATDIRLLEGDGLVLLAKALADTPDPVCVYHSACLFYWPEAPRDALNQVMLDASRSRDIWRISVEPSDIFTSWTSGRTEVSNAKRLSRHSGEISIWRYQGGNVEREAIASNTANYDVIEFFE